MACNPVEFSCLDGVDDDCDTRIDCADADCDARVCNDGNTCTSMDRCANGTCGGTTTTCGAPPGTPSCYGPGSCLGDGGCAFPFLADAGCDDGNACTTGDRCSGGTCQGTPRSCPAPGPCFGGAGACNPATGQCSFTAADAGTPCDDGNLCTHSDRCVDAGVCQGFPRCAFIANPCTTGVCDPTSGVCGTGTNRPNGTACTQEAFGGFGCPITGTCQNGSCMGTSPPVACNDFNVCTVNDTCTATGACMGTLATSCDDSNPCTVNDTCSSGTCAGTPRTGTCNDNNPCTANDVCANSACTGTALTGGACDDANACTTNDVCQMGVCRGTNLPANTPIGPRPTDRCCVSPFGGGVAFATDISNSTSDCGGCGITCGGFLNFFGCVPTKGALTCGDPPSGRCACTGPFASPAPNSSGWTCNAQGLWVPSTTASCVGGQLISAAGACPAYCAP